MRRRLGAGADVVKFYADYRKRELQYPPQKWLVRCQSSSLLKTTSASLHAK